MYCASCGKEIDEVTSYCPECGHEIGTNPVSSSSDPVDGEFSEKDTQTGDGVDYDIIMSIEDALRRRTALRLVLDAIALIVTGGIWAGWLAVEFIEHHYNLNKGVTEPYEEGDEKSFSIR